MQVSSMSLLFLTSSFVLQVHGNTKAPLLQFRRQPAPESVKVFAFCQMEPSSDLAADLPSIRGSVLFSQRYPGGRLKADINLAGFALTRVQPLCAIHVHQYGVLNGSCPSTGPHYNPHHVNHPLHPGDFNNFRVRNGKIVEHLRNLRASLFGPESILGRAVVIHEKEDDLGLGGDEESVKNGNAGRKLACCTIAVSNGDLWRQMVPNQ
ncbi:extracellular superoxide dismutase [Cu-Zn] [Narcine bancroftii]|uniref:extracellular superoxide dismutase [Cu-Zn] n=1 Tax=Narcine bancroftii TaxID=1343680 RepID=UPI0038313572